MSTVINIQFVLINKTLAEIRAKTITVFEIYVGDEMF